MRPAAFRRDGVVWTLAFGGLSVQLTHQKGFLDLAQLLARPGTEMHCLELADRPAETGGDVPVLDDRARRELKARVRDLQQEIDEADARCTTSGRAERAREELDQIVEHLSGALGLGGRARQLGSRGRARAVCRDLANSERDQEDRVRASPAGPASGECASARARSASTSRKRLPTGLFERSVQRTILPQRERDPQIDAAGGVESEKRLPLFADVPGVVARSASDDARDRAGAFNAFAGDLLFALAAEHEQLRRVTHSAAAGISDAATRCVPRQIQIPT